jgi:alpha-galactosidase
VDYLKYDWCSSKGIDAKVAYKTMREALDATGRTIVFSMCEWGTHQPWTWARGIGDLWRTTGDIQDCWDCKAKWGGLGWTRILDLNADLAQYAGPGGWNDPDMLEVGNGGMTPAEYRAHFALWALMASPLMAGNDIRSMSPETRAILTNKEIIALDQDPLGKQGTRIRDDGDLEVWTKPLEDGSVAVGLLNRGGSAKEMRVTWKELGLPAGAAHVRDLWAGKDLGSQADGYGTSVPSHECVVLRVKAGAVS